MTRVITITTSLLPVFRSRVAMTAHPVTTGNTHEIQLPAFLTIDKDDGDFIISRRPVQPYPVKHSEIPRHFTC